MSKFILIVFCTLISVSISAETVYKKTNPDGSVEFTDTGSVDSEKVKVRKPTTYTPPRLPALDLPRKKLSPTFNYVLSITQPTSDAVITDKTGVTVSVSLQPDLFSSYGHQIRYQLGGDTIISRKTSEIFKNVSRGTHNLTVSIVDGSGNIVSSVAATTFHMKRFFKKPAAKKTKPKVP